MKNAVEETLQKFKRIDILINSKCTPTHACTFSTTLSIPSGAAGNFLCPAASLSSNAFRTGKNYNYNDYIKLLLLQLLRLTLLVATMQAELFTTLTSR